MPNRELRDRYEWLLTLPASTLDVVEHMLTFVQTVEELDATRVIELGTRYGPSTIAWLYALEDRGKLWAVDCSFPCAASAVGIDAPPGREYLLDPQSPLGVLPHWIFILGYSTAPMVVEALPNDVDIVFIDTNHVYGETVIELELYYPKMRKGGRILLHDTALESTPNSTNPNDPLFPVRTAMAQFCAKYGLTYDNVDNCNGLGTIYC